MWNKRSSKAPVLKSVTLYFCALTLLQETIVKAQTGSLNRINNIVYHDYNWGDETRSKWLHNVSLMGGARMKIRGKFEDAEDTDTIFNSEAELNGFKFWIDDNNWAGNSQAFQGPPIDEGDRKNSRPSQGRLTYTTPSFYDFFEWTPDYQWMFTDFHYLFEQGHYLLKTQMSVVNLETLGEIQCKNHHACDVRYQIRSTPMLWDTIPSNLHRGKEIEFIVNPMGARYAINNEDFLMESMVINGKFAEFEYFKFEPEYRTSSYLPGSYGAFVGNSKASAFEEPQIEFRVGYQYSKTTALHGNYAEDDWWFVRVHPYMTSVEKKVGNTGQKAIVKLRGMDFLFDSDVEITVDGIDCPVKKQWNTKIKCKTAEAAPTNSLSGVTQPGQYGLRLRTFIPKAGERDVDIADMRDGSGKLLADMDVQHTSFEYREFITDRYGSMLSGFFKAPSTGRFRFRMSCDDQCFLDFDSTAFNPDDPSEPTFVQVAQRVSAVQWRHQFLENEDVVGADNSPNSDWFDLEEGKFYPIRGLHREYTGGDHFSVGVEEEVANSIGSWHDRKQVQRFRISQEGNFETWFITVDNPDGGEYQLTFGDSERPDQEPWTTDNIPDDASDVVLRSRIDDYFWKYSSPITVTRTCYDQNGDVDYSEECNTKLIYKIQLNRRRNGASFDQYFVTSSTGGIVTVQPPLGTPTETYPVQPSDPPIEGKFRIICEDPVTWNLYETTDINYNAGIASIHLAIMETMPHLTFHSSIFQSYYYPYRENGVEFFLQTDYTEGALVTGGMQPCTIVDAPDALDGSFMGITGQNVQFEVEEIVPFGVNKFWPAIPMEMLRTDDKEPPVLAKIGGLEVLCPDLNCSFINTEATNELITAFELDQNNLLTITGTDLPTDPANIEVEFAYAECQYPVTAAADGTQITCTLDHDAEAGYYFPEVDGPNGIVAIDDNLDELFIPLVVTDIQPKDNLNGEGGDNIEITGSGFPNEYKSDFTIQLPGRKDLCQVIPTQTPGRVQCVTNTFNQEGFTYTANVGMPVIVQLNGLTDTSQQITVGSINYSALSVNPVSLSPVLRQSIVITFDSSVPEAMFADSTKFTTYLHCPDCVEDFGELEMYVESAGLINGDKTITVKFPGAPTGNYKIKVHHVDQGYFDTAMLSVSTEAIVTMVSRNSGSVLGGAELTITGINFSDDPLDNPVTVDGRACLVTSTSATTIKCRITRDLDTTEVPPARRLQSLTDMVDESVLVKDGKIVVYLSTSEEAQWDSATALDDWIWEEPAAEITTIVTAADATTQFMLQTATVIGTGFPTNSNDASLFVDGVQQQTVSSSATEMVFILDKITSGSLENFLIYLPDGLPTNTDNFTSITLVPSFYGFFFGTGSAGGGTMSFGATGIGSETDISTIDLVVSSDGFATAGDPLCEEMKVAGTGLQEGTFTCLIGEREITSSDEIRLQVGSDVIECINTSSPAMCSYEALIANSPTVSNFDITDKVTVTITGSNFQQMADEGFEPGVLLDGVSSEGANSTYQDATMINSDTSITVKFQWGVPKFFTPKYIYLGFQDSSGRIMVAYQGPTKATIAYNPLTILFSWPNVKCSFEGGCEYYINSEGLASELRPEVFRNNNNYIDICGRTCVVDWDKSDVDWTTCILPHLPTKFSVSEYQLQPVTNVLLDATITASTPSEIGKLTDGSLLVEYQDSGSTCFIDFEFKEDYHGVLDSVSFYIDMIEDISPFVGSLVFEGSNDGGSTWDALWYPDASIQEGWNMKWWADDNCVEGNSIPDKPSYNKYRFYGTSVGACRFTEVTAEGVTTHVDTSFTSQCVPRVFYDDIDETNSLGFGTDYVQTNDYGGFNVLFSKTYTPVVDSISPRMGTVKGGQIVTITGSGFSHTTANCGRTTSPCTADPVIKIDGIDCVLQSGWSDTELRCETAPKVQPYNEHDLTIFIEGKGYAATKGNRFIYGHMWSDNDTWGKDTLPQEGEAVHVPTDAVIIMDVDTTPQLSLITVEGSLIIAPDADPNHQRELHAEYIIVRHGTLEIGTKEHPYTSRLAITLYGTEEGPFVPIYGNAVIGVRDGTLELHGQPRSHTWSMLYETASAGATTIKLIEMEEDVVLDWIVGEQIVIATTEFDSEHSEVRTITGVADASTFPVITLDLPLDYTHFAATEIVGEDSGDFIDMRAEVGLLSRNVKIQGGPQDQFDDMFEMWSALYGVETAMREYGAHIYIHTIDTAPSIARIEDIELYSVGQGYRVDRYPIHFDTVGSSHRSSISNNSIWNSYNKGIVLSNTQYLKIRGNVLYNMLGHSIYNADASEIHNCIAENLVMDTRKSWSMLNTDQYPGSIWLRHPNNIVRDNHVAGSDSYGIVYDLPDSSSGVLDDPNICPNYANLGEFHGNVAHSNGRYGLFLKSQFSPRQYPCFDMDDIYDGNDPDNYGIEYRRRLQTSDFNPPVPAIFTEFTSFKNGRDGAMAVSIGSAHFIDFKTADNIDAGVEVHDCGTIPLGYATISGGVFIGKTTNTETLLDEAAPVGIWMPSSDNFLVEFARFFNFDQTGVDGTKAAAFATASNSASWTSTGAGAFQYETTGLFFNETVTRLVRFEYPYKEFFLDRDGSLTGRYVNGVWTPVYGADTYVAADWKHLRQEFCTYDQESVDYYGGLVCDDSAQLRRITFHSAQPSVNFRGQPMKICKFDVLDEFYLTMSGGTAKKDWLDDEDNYSIVPHKSCTTHSCTRDMSWAIPFATGRRYSVHWGYHQDFTSLRMELSKYWLDTDNTIVFRMNFTDVREEINFTYDYGQGEQIQNTSFIYTSPADQTLGDNVVYNQTDKMYFEYVANYRNITRGKELLIEGFKCLDGICGENLFMVPLEENQRAWSNPASWDWVGNTLPVEGDDVVIPPGVNMLFDLNNSPILNSLEINGRLQFKNQENWEATLNSMKIHVRAGELVIGAETQRYLGTAKILLHGHAESESLRVKADSQTLNKALVNTGRMEFWGQSRKGLQRLKQSVEPGDNQAFIESAQDIFPGDTLYFGPTAMQENHGEYMTVDTYNGFTGLLTLVENFQFYHFGAYDTGKDYYYDNLSVDMSGEVAVLTRNVVIEGTGEDAWGCQVLTTDMMDYQNTTIVTRRGVTIFQSVEVAHCSQRDTSRAAVQFDGANSAENVVKDSSIWDGLGWGLSINLSTGVSIDDIVVVGFMQQGIMIDMSTDVTVSCAFVSQIGERDKSNLVDGLHDPTVGISACAWNNPTTGSVCTNVQVACSIVSGVVGAGFIAPGVTCGEAPGRKFKDNVAHSVKGVGAIVFPDPNEVNSKKCYEISHFVAYKNQEQGLATYFNSQKIMVHYSVFIDNALGVSLQIGGEYNDAEIHFYDSSMYGESGDIALDGYGTGTDEFCQDKNGFMLAGHNRGSKAVIEGRAGNLPFYKTIHPGGWGAQAYIHDVKFENFEYVTQCGATQVIFKNSDSSSDFIPLHHLDDCTFDNVDDSAVISVVPLPLTYIQISECGNFPCTGNKNIVIQYDNLEFEGSAQPTMPGTGTISSAISQRIYPLFGCSLNTEWSAWLCSDIDIGQLLFESQDDDRWDRSMQPIYIFDTLGYVNVLNSFRDHFNDGYYTSQERLSRFNAAIKTDVNFPREYTVKFTGTPPQKMKFQLNADAGGMVIKIPFYSAGSYQVSVDGVVKPMTAWDPNLGAPGALTKMNGCGENRFVSIMNFLEFYITAGCTLEVLPRDAIQGMVRLEWSLSEFYGKGGVTRFVDRLAGSIGIHRSRIKVVHIYEGSVIVDFFIDAESSSSDDPEGSQKELKSLTDQLLDVITNGNVDFGAPVIGFESESELLYGDPIPPDTASVNTQSQAVRTDDTNLYDRFVRIQELLNERMDESLFDEPLITLDTSEEGSEDEETKQKTVYLTLDELQTGAALKYSILILGFLVLISLIITSICIFRCITRSRRQVMETIKAQELAAKNRELEETQVQFANSQAQETINQTRTNTFGPLKAQKQKDIKGMQDDVVLPDGAENVAVVDLKTRKTKKKKRKVLTKKIADADAEGLGDASKRTDFFNSSTNFNATSKSLRLGEISEVQSSGLSLNDKNDA